MRQDVLPQSIVIKEEYLPTCSDESEETWEEDFFTSLNSEQHSMGEEGDCLHCLTPSHLLQI